MYRVSSLVLAVLLTGTLLWGQCASCPLILSAPSQHSCCGGEHGNCNMPHPKQQSEKQCATQALAPDLYPAASAAPALMIAIVPAVAADIVPAPTFVETAYTGGVPAYSPPDLYLLNSTILA